jgi:aerobic carbon-monoxide dehydrogenase small subunit
MDTRINLVVNGDPVSLVVESQWSMLRVLRERLGLMGTKEGCGGEGECGACTIIAGGASVNACLLLAVEADGLEIQTVEGLAGPDGTLHPLQRAFIDKAAVQCGFCTPGMLMSAKALLDGNLDPTEEEVREAIAGNICRCTGYTQIVEAVLTAAAELRAAADVDGGTEGASVAAGVAV